MARWSGDWLLKHSASLESSCICDCKSSFFYSFIVSKECSVLMLLFLRSSSASMTALESGSNICRLFCTVV